MSTHMKGRASGIVLLILALLVSLLPLAQPVLAVDALAIEKINNLYQWANGTPTKDPKWQFGNLNASNSVYYEGDSVPYYNSLSDLNVNDIYYITIEWDTTKGGKHAIDYITTYDRSYTPDDPSVHAGLSTDLSPDTEPIPIDANIPADPNWVGTQEAGSLTIFHGTFTDATGDVNGDATTGYTLTGSYAGDSSTSITFYFRADEKDIVIAWGGHVAAQADWGAGNSAINISGSPYHMRILDFYNVSQDNQLNVGNLDRSMSAATVTQTPIIAIVKTVDPTIVSSPQSVTYTYQVTNEGNVSLTGVTVTDDNGTPGDTGDDFSPTYVSGDDGDNELDVGETWIYTATRNITQDDIDDGSPITNWATADSNESEPDSDDATVTILIIEDEYDFGDAPDPTYPTLSVSNGANHIIVSGFSLGLSVDYEVDGQPSNNALGDDNDGNDDEDGVTIPVLVTGQQALINVEVSGTGGIVEAWIDFNGDGIWQHPGEQIFAGFLNAGTHSIMVMPPIDVVTGKTFARFRLSSQGGLTPSGLAPDGEVEDYTVVIRDVYEVPTMNWWGQLAAMILFATMILLALRRRLHSKAT